MFHSAQLNFHIFEMSGDIEAKGIEALPVVHLHPNLSEVYRRKVAELEIALNDESIKTEGQRAPALAGRSDRAQAGRRCAGGIDAELHGDLAGIL